MLSLPYRRHQDSHNCEDYDGLIREASPTPDFGRAAELLGAHGPRAMLAGKFYRNLCAFWRCLPAPLASARASARTHVT